jgi:hypothetical protein
MADVLIAWVIECTVLRGSYWGLSSRRRTMLKQRWVNILGDLRDAKVLENKEYSSLDGLMFIIDAKVRSKLHDCVVRVIDRLQLDPTGVDFRTIVEQGVYRSIEVARKVQPNIAKAVKRSLCSTT